MPIRIRGVHPCSAPGHGVGSQCTRDRAEVAAVGVQRGRELFAPLDLAFGGAVSMSVSGAPLVSGAPIRRGGVLTRQREGR